jgi:glutamyl-tRNA reductase
MQRLLLLGLNHQTAPLDVREKLAFSDARRREAIAEFCRRFDSCELVILSTCNRVELYAARAVHGHPRIEELTEFLAEFHSIPADAFKGHLYAYSEHEAVEHLFKVASSLDSMVLGETQILGQVRESYAVSQELLATGGTLNPLFQRAIAVGKRVMNETALNEGRLSVASVAVDYARRIFDHFDDKTVLCIGAGKMAGLALRGFEGLSPHRLLVCNRDPEKAAVLAREFNGAHVPFEAMESHLTAADIVISSTGAQRPIITRRQFDGLLKQRRYRPIFLIDIALPRDVEASVGELENVYLYNLDDLQQVVAATQTQRKDAVEAARGIVAEQVQQFALWHRAHELGPVIDRLYKRYHELAQVELDRTLSKLPGVSPAERAHLEDLARRIVNKLLHDPIRTLRESDGLHVPTAQYLHAMEKLFQLKDEPDDDGASKPH